MLTAEQRKVYEVAARLYCQRIGEDPEARVPMPNPNPRIGEPVPGRMWWLAAEKIHDQSMMLTAMRDAAIAKNQGAVLTDPPPATSDA
jgi:hypothetical protein